MALSTLFGWCIAVVLIVLVIPRHWVQRACRLEKRVDGSEGEEIVAATTDDPAWMVSVRFLVAQFKSVIATVVAIVIVVASLYHLLTGGQDVEWAKSGIAGGTSFLFGEVVGAAAAKSR